LDGRAPPAAPHDGHCLAFIVVVVLMVGLLAWGLI
jgi:hypothetical protein